jgi:hypothetical protein
VASDREIEALRKDADRWRALARQVFRYADRGVLDDNDLDFLEQIPERKWLDELSYRQAEYLLNLRDAVETVSSHRGFGVRYLAKACFDHRFGLDDEEEEAWVLEVYQSGVTSVLRRQARRLYMLAKRLGEIEGD